MRESMNNTIVFNIVLVFVGIVMALLIGSLSYSKAFKVKNRIIEVIEKHAVYDSYVRQEIDEVLSSIGYRVNPTGNQDCPDREGATIINVFSSSYRYCVYEYYTSKGKYYGILTYMYFDVPVIGNRLEFPVYGETKIIYDI